MKRVWILLGAVSLLVLPAQMTWAKCTPLIREGRELLTKANLPADEASRIKALLDESQKFRDAGNHVDGVKKASEALNLLKKK